MKKTWREVTAERQEELFVDYKKLLPLFKKWLGEAKLPKKLLLIYGVGGSGKSSYLNMFEKITKGESIPVATMSRGDARSSVDILRGWAKELSSQSISLPSFEKALKQHDAIKSKVDLATSENEDAASSDKVLRSLKKSELKLLLDPKKQLTKKLLLK
jgi:predicted AAA+ superfamily ATPase